MTIAHWSLLAAAFAVQGWGADARLATAIKDDNRKAVESLIAAKADVNAPLPDGSTPLAWAAYKDDEAIVDLLLAAGAKAATADDYGETPLTLACVNGNPRIAARLLKAGADPNAGRWNGETALMLASRSGNAELARLLIAAGAKVDAVESRKGQNALMWASAEGHTDVVGVLLDAGAKPNTASKAGFTPLIFAAMNGSAATITRLARGGAELDYSAPGAGASALTVALAAPKFEAARALIAAGAKVTTADRAGNTPLHIASQAGQLEIVKDLLSKGADVNAATAQAQGGGRGGGGGRGAVGKQTALHLAARGNHVEVMRTLVAAGANPAAKAQDGSTLLIAAAASGRVPAVEYAFQLAPDIAAATAAGQTPMHAALTGTMQVSTPAEIQKVIQFLADHGAELDAPDGTGRTPLDLARSGNTAAAVFLEKLIRASGKEPRTRRAAKQ